MQYIERPQDILLLAFLLVNSSKGNVFHGNCPKSSHKLIGQVPCQLHFSNFKMSFYAICLAVFGPKIDLFAQFVL